LDFEWGIRDHADAVCNVIELLKRLGVNDGFNGRLTTIIHSKHLAVIIDEYTKLSQEIGGGEH